MKQYTMFVLLAAIAIVSLTAALAVPATPTVAWPTAGMVVQSDRPDIRWNGSGYDSYEVHICTTNDPNNPNGWDSGQVADTSGTAMSGALSPQTTYYVFVRIHDANGWSAWSASGDSFYVDGQFMNDPYWVDGGGGTHWQHAIAYNPTRNEYLLVYYDCSGVKPMVVYYRLDSTGARIGAKGYTSDTLDGWGDPAVCYNSARQEYLISYDGWNSVGRQLKTQRVDATNGALIGGPGYIAGVNGLMLSRVAYSPTSNCYLLAWDTNIAPGYVHAQRLDSTAVPVGSSFSISGSHYWAGVNSIAYNSVDNEFLVTFQCYENGGSNGWDCGAQRVRASDGALMGSNIAIAATTDDESACYAAYDSNMDRYLVVFEGGSPSPWGQFVSASGSLVGAKFRITSDDYYNGGMTAVTWNPGTREYLVTWAHCCSSSNYARRYSQTGSAIGEPFKTTGTITGTGDWNPIPVINTTTGEYLIVWFWQYDSIYVRRYKTFAPPAYAPGPVTNFAAGSGNGVANLTWTNPTGSVFTGTMIRYRTDTYPTSPTDGTLAVDKAGTPGANDSYTHTGRTNGTTYYYTAFAHDVTPLYSAGVSAWTVPTAPTCYSDNFSYSDGALNSNGGWSGAATSAQIAINAQTVKMLAGTGTVSAAHTNLCGDPGQGFMWVDVKIKSGVGSTQLYNLWIDDTAGANLARWYGSGTTARGRIGGTASVTATQTLTGGWDDLAVKINPYTNTSEFFFNGVSLGVLDHGQTGANNTIGALRFERSDSGANPNDYVYFDTMLIGQPGDVTPPNPVTNFTATAGDGSATLSWVNPTQDWAGTMVRYKTTGYPTGPTDGSQSYNGTGTTYSSTGLPNDTTYYCTAYAYDAALNYSTGVNVSVTPHDSIAPGNVTGFTATPGDMQNSLVWTKPGDSDLAGVKIMFKTTGYPTGPADGTQCYIGTGTSYTHTSLTNGTTYYYKAFTYDEVPNYASGAQASGVPADTVAPGNVTAFTATAGDTQNVLAWTKPGDADLAGVKIMFKTTGYPTGPADGTQCYSGTGTGTTHTGLTNGTTYYYKAFAFDEVPNYASGATASATPVAPPCFRDQFTYANGALNGNGGWSGSATSAHIAISSNTVKVLSGATQYESLKTVSCSTGSQTYIWVRCQIQKGVGANTIWDLYINDAAGNNFARWYGTGTTARGRIAGSGLVTATQTLTGGWDNIDVKIVPSALTAEFFFNGTSLGALSYSGNASGTTIGQLRFVRENNNVSGEYAFFDDVRVGG